MITRKHARSKRSGMMVLEFALGAGVLMTSFGGVFSYGYAFYRYNELLTAVTTGARYAAMSKWDQVGQTASSAFETRVKNIVVYGNPAGGSTPIIRGFTTANVVLTPITARVGTSNIYTPTHMRVSITNFSVPGLFKSFNFSGKPRVQYPFSGLLAPVSGGL
jgi:Flp pilus assembly protein TadG